MADREEDVWMSDGNEFSLEQGIQSLVTVLRPIYDGLGLRPEALIMIMVQNFITRA